MVTSGSGATAAGARRSDHAVLAVFDRAPDGPGEAGPRLVEAVHHEEDLGCAPAEKLGRRRLE